MNPKYPIYIPSKGRWGTRMTARSLERLGVPYYIVIEPQEYLQYSNVIDKEKILVLPFTNKKLMHSRIWIMEHSISRGDKRHWQIDDNINHFYRLNKNLKVPIGDGTMFRVAEDFTDRYENIAISGPNYFMFANYRDRMPPYKLNTRVYSCSLINNDIPHRHRRIYNDDTDICLCVLKDGWCTILFNAFLIEKTATMKIKGGNTEDLYLIKDGRLKMAESLVKDHPDVAEITWKWGRWQHQVNYTPFKKNKLIKKEGLVIPKGINNYGMVLREERKVSKLSKGV